MQNSVADIKFCRADEFSFERKKASVAAYTPFMVLMVLSVGPEGFSEHEATNGVAVA